MSRNKSEGRYLGKIEGRYYRDGGYLPFKPSRLGFNEIQIGSGYFRYWNNK